MSMELRRMVVEAEGRYLTDTEIGRLREHALGFSTRLMAARQMEDLETSLVGQALDRLTRRHPEIGSRSAEVPRLLANVLRGSLKAVAAGHVRQDREHFRRAYATWVIPMARSVVDPKMLAEALGELRGAIDEQFDGSDARDIREFVEILIEEIGR
jgi:hypothetical protein